MGLRILHSADLHLDSPFSGFDAGRRQYLRDRLRGVPRLLEDLCRRSACQLVLLSGDLFDSEPTRESLDELKAALRGFGVPVFISPGNHDHCGPASFWRRERWPENVYIFTGGLESVALEHLDCRIWGAAFTGMDSPALLEGFRASGSERYQLGVFHGELTASDSPYNPIHPSWVKDFALDYLALGHIHKAASYRSGGTLCAWPGCPMGRGWDETGEKGVYIVDLEEQTRITWHSLGLPCFYEEQLEVRELEDRLSQFSDAHFYRITLVGSTDTDVETLLRRYAHIPNLFFIDRTQPPLDLWGEAGEDSLEGVYFAKLRQAAEAAQGRERERILQAAYISRQLLEGREVKLP